LAELKDLIIAKPEHPKPQLKFDSVAEHKAFFEAEFGEIKQLIHRIKDYSDDLQNIIQEQRKTKRFLIRFLISMFTLFTIGAFAFTYFFFKSFSKH